MNIDEIMALLPHRYPFLMIDRVEQVEPGVRATAIKCVSVNEPHFQGHFPTTPIMPGVLICEAFAQTAGIVALSAQRDLAGKTVYLLGLDGVRFRRPVRPGDRLEIRAEKESSVRGIWKFRVEATVEGTRVANGTVMATVADAED